MIEDIKVQESYNPAPHLLKKDLTYFYLLLNVSGKFSSFLLIFYTVFRHINHKDFLLIFYIILYKLDLIWQDKFIV